MSLSRRASAVLRSRSSAHEQQQQKEASQSLSRSTSASSLSSSSSMTKSSSSSSSINCFDEPGTTDNESTSTENEKRKETDVKATDLNLNKQERRENILEKLISDKFKINIQSQTRTSRYIDEEKEAKQTAMSKPEPSEHLSKSLTMQTTRRIKSSSSSRSSRMSYHVKSIVRKDTSTTFNTSSFNLRENSSLNLSTYADSSYNNNNNPLRQTNLSSLAAAVGVKNAKNMNIQAKLNNTDTSDKNGQANKGIVTVDTSKARSNAEVLRMCLKELGWQDCPAGLPNGCDIIWQSCTSHEGDQTVANTHFAHSRVNKFPNMNYLLRKGPLTRSLNVMRSIYSKKFDFYPRTWFLPEQFKEFSQDCRFIHERQSKLKQHASTFIVKPNDGSQGDGIILIKSPDEYVKAVAKTRNASKIYIVQEYIHNPFLIDGLKFDLRIYVVIVSLKPLEIHICDEGLVRFATVNYQSPNENNLNEIYMHLTNYSLNKKNQSYKFTAEGSTLGETSTTTTSNDQAVSPGQGSKRKLTRIFNFMQSKGINVNKIKAAIDDLVVKTVFSLLPEMKVECAFEAYNAPNKQKSSSFQILGFDILLKDDLKPVLLEVNCNPSLRVDYELESHGKSMLLPSPIDIDIKKPLVLETLRLVAPRKKIQLIEKTKKEEEIKERAQRFRNHIVQQRIEQRQESAKKTWQFDIDKCPLLSKPGELYKRKLKQSNCLRNDTSLLLPEKRILSMNDLTLKSQTSQKSEPSEWKQSNGNLAPKSQENQSVSCLRNIYPNRSKLHYSYLFLLEHIADLFIYFSLPSANRNMQHADFRSFIKKCNIISKKLSADNLDIIYFDLSKKWQSYNKRKVQYEGLCFQGFVEFFLKLSRLVFDENSVEQSLKSLVYFCKYSLQRPNPKSNPFYDMELTDLLFPLSQKLVEKLATLDEYRNKTNTSTQSKYSNVDRLSPSKYFDNKTSSSSLQKSSDLKSSSSKSQSRSKASLFPIFFDTLSDKL